MKFCVKRYWEVCDEVEVEADDEEGAIEAANEAPLGKDPQYVPDSMNIDPEMDVQEIV